MQTSLTYCALHAAKEGLARWSRENCRISAGLNSGVQLHRSSKPNELILNTIFYDSVCLKGPHV